MILFVKDLGSSPLLKFASNVERTVKRVNKVTGSLDKNLLDTTKKVNVLSRAFTKVGSSKTFSGLNKSLQTASGHLDRIQQKANRLRTTGANTGSSGRSGGGSSVFGLGSIAATAEAYFSFQGMQNLLNLGSQFTSEVFSDHVLDQGIRLSMDGKGRATDNAFIERLWRSVKYEKLYLNPAETGQDWSSMIL